MDNEIYAAVDIGGTKIAYGIFDRERRLIAKRKKPTDLAAIGPEFFQTVIENIENLLLEKGYEMNTLSGIGIGMPGMITPEGQVALIAMLPKLQGFDAGGYFRKLLPDKRVRLANDSHCAALAEYRYGAGRGHRHMLYCPVSTGLASGIIIDGKLFTGSNGAAGESGHTIVSPEGGIACGCGNVGCVCSYASGSLITRHIQNWIAAGQSTLMTALAGSAEAITPHHISEAFRAGDRMAERALDQMGFYLGLWVFNLYLTLNIDCFVFGGGLINLGDMLFDRVKKTFYEHCFTNFPVTFNFAELGQDSGLLGALELLF